VENHLEGWVNVPADCVRPLQKIVLHAARPAGINEPTDDGVVGTERILDIVGSLGPDDACIVLISGGGSALLPAPVVGISLSDKQQVTRFLMSSGATINELNTVRKQLSRIKGGRLAAAARNAGAIITLIISDVVDDPLDIIASGPTTSNTSTPAQALATLQKFSGWEKSVPTTVVRHLEREAGKQTPAVSLPSHVVNHVIGNNQTALVAAKQDAERRGFRVISLGSDVRGVARDIGSDLARRCRQIGAELRSAAGDSGATSGPVCLLSGGEPVVHLTPTDRPRKGGRNQECALAALAEFWRESAVAASRAETSGTRASPSSTEPGLDSTVILSGGTDGEDGPTDAAGAIAELAVAVRARRLGLDPGEYLAINDAYTFFEQAGGLLITGPTHTNVMDLRVALVTN